MIRPMNELYEIIYQKEGASDELRAIGHPNIHAHFIPFIERLCHMS